MNNGTVSLSKGGLFSKVSLLLTASMGISAFGTLSRFRHHFDCRNHCSRHRVSPARSCAVRDGRAARKRVSSPLPHGLSSVVFFLGPTINHYVASLGWQTVFLCFLGTGGVAAACGAIGALSGRDFSNMGKYLMFALLALIVVGIVNIFVAFSSGVTIIYCPIGMAVFAGFFIYDFFRISKAENTWFNAITATMEIYLDFINFLLYLLRFIRGGHRQQK